MQAYTLRGTRVTRLTTKIVPHSRALHTTPTTAKQQRRQEFFEFNLPPDPTTVRERGVGKFRLQALQQLRGMEVGRESTAVKYGSVAFGLRDPSAPKRESAGFGLRQPARELRQVRGEGDAAEGGEGSESGTAGTISQVSPQELNLNWRAAVRRFRSGENPLDGLHKRKVTPPAGRKRRGTPDLVEPETAAERDERVRTAKDRKTKKRALREIETRDEHLDRSEFNKERRIKGENEVAREV
jgi:hypothetical protein